MFFLGGGSGDDDGFGLDSSPKGTPQTSDSSSSKDYFGTADWNLREANDNDSFSAIWTSLFLSSTFSGEPTSLFMCLVLSALFWVR